MFHPILPPFSFRIVSISNGVSATHMEAASVCSTAGCHSSSLFLQDVCCGFLKTLRAADLQKLGQTYRDMMQMKVSDQAVILTQMSSMVGAMNANMHK